MMLTGLGLVSCSHDSGPGVPETPALPGTMAIAVSLEGSTRAGLTPDGYETGSELENTLNLSRGYRIMFFTADGDGGGKYIASFYANYNPPQVRPDGTYRYNLIGSFPNDLPTKFKLVVMANWPGYPSEAADAPLLLQKGVTTIKDVTTHQSSQFDYAQSLGSWIDEDHLIPFYGVREYDLSQIDNSIIGNDGKIKEDAYINLSGDNLALPLLRAMAKVEVVLDNDLMAFESVSIDRYNAKGFCAPYSSDSDWKYDHSDYDHNSTWSLDYVKALHLTAAGNANDAGVKTERVEFKKISDATPTTKERWVAYIPEYRNVGVDDYCSITVAVATPDGTPESVASGKYTKKIYFATNGSSTFNDLYADTYATLTQPGRYNIERNNIYRFSVTNTSGPTDLEVSVDVQPFSELAYDYELGLSRDEYGDLVVNEDSRFWELLQGAFEEHPEYRPHTGNYVGGDFIHGKWSDNGVFTATDLSGADVLDYHKDINDYYSIVLAPSGRLTESELWLKDSDGCRVLSNFGSVVNAAGDADNGNGCSARMVRDFSLLTPVDYFKDKDGFQRLQHNHDHTSIVLSHAKEMLFKTVKEGDDGSYITDKIYRVEDWTPFDKTAATGGGFWYLFSVASAADNGWSQENPDGMVTLTYRYGDINGEKPEGDASNPDKEVTVKFSELSDVEKDYLENQDKGQ